MSHDVTIFFGFLPYQNSLGKVSYTVDLWSDSKLQSFLAITAHWIARNNNSLELKSSLIAFHRVWGRHTGENLATIILSLLDRAGATSKVNYMQYEMCHLTEIVQDWSFYLR
jgi:hypothetical protein